VSINLPSLDASWPKATSPGNINTVFVILVLSCISCALPAWEVFLSAAQCSKLMLFFKRAHKYGFTNVCFTVSELFATYAADLYQKIQSPTHCLHMLVP